MRSIRFKISIASISTFLYESSQRQRFFIFLFVFHFFFLFFSFLIHFFFQFVFRVQIIFQFVSQFFLLFIFSSRFISFFLFLKIENENCNTKYIQTKSKKLTKIENMIENELNLMQIWFDVKQYMIFYNYVNCENFEYRIRMQKIFAIARFINCIQTFSIFIFNII